MLHLDLDLVDMVKSHIQKRRKAAELNVNTCSGTLKMIQACALLLKL